MSMIDEYDITDFGERKRDRNIPIVIFSVKTLDDIAASKREGRPIVHQYEECYISFPADPQRDLHVPAHAVWTKIRGQPVTYAQRFAKQYERFKNTQPQLVEGTPIEEAPFLTEAQRAICRQLKVYTVEQLAGLSGDPLRRLGPGGREQQQAAEKYLAAATNSAVVTALAAENEKLKATVQQMARDQADPRLKYAEMDTHAMKVMIKAKTGEMPKGAPNRGTLIRMLIELERTEGKPIEMPEFDPTAVEDELDMRDDVAA